ncbi:MAG: hypothetical protein ACKO5F_09540 [Synechococcus sp.]
MNRSLQSGWWAALLTRLPEPLMDPGQIAFLQERLARHGAELQGQIPELLLRSSNPEEAIRSWLADKDLSHWWPQAQGGTAEQGWQFETASWNRSRGAEAMDPAEIATAHADGGLDALFAPGVPADLAGHGLEAALLAASIRLAWHLLRLQPRWAAASRAEKPELVREAVREAGLSALSGASFSLVISLALAFIPGGQAWLLGTTLVSLSRLLPGPGERAFDLRCWTRATGSIACQEKTLGVS